MVEKQHKKQAAGKTDIILIPIFFLLSFAFLPHSVSADASPVPVQKPSFQMNGNSIVFGSADGQAGKSMRFYVIASSAEMDGLMLGVEADENVLVADGKNKLPANSKLSGFLNGCGNNKFVHAFDWTPSSSQSGYHSIVFIPYKKLAAGGKLYGDPATVTVRIANAEGVLPMTASDQQVRTYEDNEVQIALVVDNVQGTNLQSQIMTQAQHGTAVCSKLNCTYRPFENYNGSDRFVYRVVDGSRVSNLAAVSVEISPIDDRPVLSDIPADAAAGSPVEIVLGPKKDPDGETIVYSVDMPPHHGTVAIRENIAIYTPHKGYAGPDPFTYTASEKPVLPAGDDYYLFDTDVQVFRRTDGTQNFTVSYMGSPLRIASDNDRFFLDPNTKKLDIRYNIVPKKGGADIQYTVRNLNTERAKYPFLTVPGIKQDNLDSFDMLVSYYVKDMHLMKFTESDLNHDHPPHKFYYSGMYPEAEYIPASVIVGDTFATGISIQYEFLKNPAWLRRQIFFYQERPEGTFLEHKYWFFGFDEKTHKQTDDLWIEPQGERTFTISVRFAPPKDWIFTLNAYKEFFQQTYPGSKRGTVHSRDTRPINGFSVSNWGWAVYRDANGNITGLNPDNPRGFRPNGTAVKIYTDGWKPFVDDFVRTSTQFFGFERSMLWGAGGAYQVNRDNNYAPHVTTQWLPIMNDTAGEFKTFQKNGMNLGFWWGRSSQVPVVSASDSRVKDVWDPEFITSADYHNPQHMAFLKSQVQRAVELGLNEVGLDAFVYMKTQDRYRWLREMRAMAPNINFIQEVGSDFMHSEAANWGEAEWVTDYEKAAHPADDQLAIKDPNQVAWYLNPGSGITTRTIARKYQTREVFIQLMKWGYTPLVLWDCLAGGKDTPACTLPDVHGLNPQTVPIVECYNGISKDGTCETIPAKEIGPAQVSVSVS